MNPWRLVGLAIVAAVQLAVPIGSIVIHETTLREGHVWKLRTGPVDPYDAFRGRYVALWFPAGQDVSGLPPGSEPGKRLWASLATDADGFARLDAFFPRRPQDRDALAVHVQWADDQGHGSVELPFQTYWMPEDLAPAAEAAYRDVARGPDAEAWVTVRVRKGSAALEALWLEGRRIEDWLVSPSVGGEAAPVFPGP